MSAEATSWAYKVTVTREGAAGAKPETLKIASKFLLVTLGNYADHEHSSFPSVDKLAEMMSCSRRTVIDAIRTLEAAGLLVVEKRRRTNGSQTSSRYYLPVGNWAPKPAQGADSAPCETAPEPVDNSTSEAPDRVQILHQGGADSAPPLTVTLTRGTTTGPVPEVSHETAVDNSGEGRDSKNTPNPRALRATHGHPLQPADVFASVGRILPDTFDDTALEQLAAEILAKAATRVLDPTAYVISVIRSWRRPNMTGGQLVDAGEWWAVVDRIARDRQFAKLTAPLEEAGF